MAVVDLYIDTLHYNADGSLIVPGAMLPPSGHGTPLFFAEFTFETVAANDNDSIYRVLKKMPGDIIPVKFDIASDGVGGLSDVNVGLWKPFKAGVAGVVILENCLADAIDLSSAVTFASPKDGLKDVAIESRGKKRLFELAGHDILTRLPEYDIAFKAVAAESAVGTVAGILWYAQG